ncbi:hypothetical protein ACFW2D_30145 [Streptomyces sp. NPDC058914]|uniref:hypothetical protein n=1 Tax=Streptomyces TaxID=1883 RepID=UPI0036954475
MIRQIEDGPTRVQLDVEHLPDNPEAVPVPARTPRLARGLLEVLDARDGLADVTPEPQVVEAEDVDAVIDELCDETRRLPVVVASTPYGADFDAWLEGTVDPLVRPLAGLAILYVLTRRRRPVSTTRWSTTGSTAAGCAPTSRESTRPGPPTGSDTG